MCGELWKTPRKGLVTGRKIPLVFQGWIQQLSQSLGQQDFICWGCHLHFGGVTFTLGVSPCLRRDSPAHPMGVLEFGRI